MGDGMTNVWKLVACAAIAVAGYGMGNVFGLFLMGAGAIGCFVALLHVIGNRPVREGSPVDEAAYLEHAMRRDAASSAFIIGAASPGDFNTGDFGSGDFGGGDFGGGGDGGGGA